MAKRLDDQERAAWVARIERYRASGWTAAKFCRSENVVPHAFYYWAKRVGSTASGPSASRDRGGRQDRLGMRSRSRQHLPQPRSIHGDDNVARVHFRLGSNAELSIPANCTEALRCIVKCLQEPSATIVDAFQQVRLGSR